MTSRKTKEAPTKFYQEDVVQRVIDPTSRGLVLRCWHDSDELQQLTSVADPLSRPLKRGEVGVSFLPDQSREILPESEFTLVDRPMHIGDVVKRRIEDVESAVVTDVMTRFKVAHAVSGRKLDEWKTMSHVKALEDITVGDYVAYNDWVGQIQDMFDESTVEIGDGSLVRLPEVSARLSIGHRGDDILPAPPEQGLSGLLSLFMGDVRPSQNDVVVSVKHTVFAVSWMAINQMLSSEEGSSRPRPKRFWAGTDISKLSLLRGVYDYHNVRIGDRLVLKDPPKDYLTTHGRTNDAGESITVDTFIVHETETSVNILWQNGLREALPSNLLIPYLNPDEYDCWPGDHVVWKAEEMTYPAVVQSMNAVDRTAEIMLDDGRREVVSVLELDPQGTDTAMSNPQDGYGVRRGDIVFMHREGTTNGCVKPTVPGIGELEAWAHETPYVEENGEFTGWRKELDELGQKIARSRGREPMIEGAVQRPPLTDIDWLGEVVDLELNGMVKVTLMNSQTCVVPLERLSRLNDGLEPLEDIWGDELSDGHDDFLYENDSDQQIEILTEGGEWQTLPGGDDDDEWEEDEDECIMELDDGGEVSLDADDTPSESAVIRTDTVVPGAWPTLDEVTDRTSEAMSPGVNISASVVHAEANNGEARNGEASWKHFDILPSAPPDHAFYSTPPAQPSRQFMSRLAKEYRALESGLPESIIVRTYEDRADLLRSLIIGPENTPYEDAPFVIDWMLDGNFPQTPPIAHFLSWTNGNGRVNPNLYEEGKVCLSILGTWTGDRSESWSPTRSSLLQALVSIQGLVLVKEPWYCEPAYEKWRGTDEGKVNSCLYSEKAYVLSRGFVRRALEIPLGGLDSVIRDIYLTQGKLAMVIKSARALIETSKTPSEAEDDDERAVHRLTGGGVITLTRTLDKLEAILAKETSLSSSSS